jgi:hypothetical protein
VPTAEPSADVYINRLKPAPAAASDTTAAAKTASGGESRHGPATHATETDHLSKPSTSPSAAPAAAAPLVPSEAWSSARTQQLRQGLLVAVAAIAGVILAVGSVAFLATLGGNSTKVAESDANTTAPDAIAATDGNSAVGDRSPTTSADGAEANHGDLVSTMQPAGNHDSAGAESVATTNGDPPASPTTAKPSLPLAIATEKPATDVVGKEPLLLHPDGRGADSADAVALAETLNAFGRLVEDPPFGTTDSRLCRVLARA